MYCRVCNKEITDNEGELQNGCCDSCFKKIEENDEISENKMPQAPKYSTGLVIYSIIATLFFVLETLNSVGVLIKYNSEDEIWSTICSAIFLTGIFVAIPNWVHYSEYKNKFKRYKEEYDLAQKDYKAYENKIKMQEEQRKIVQKAVQESLEIDYTILVSADSKKSVSSSLVRGTIGGAVLGPAGLVAGALSGKNKSTTTFTVVYKNGNRDVVTVDNDSSEFKKYASYLK